MTQRLKNYLFCFTLFVFSISSIYADSIVSFADLNYHSDFEKETFFKLENTFQPDYFALFLAADKNVKAAEYETYKSALELAVAAFKNEKFAKYNDKKKVKKIYNSVHAAMLDKYVIKANFSQLFTAKEYQCVTSTMLFALVFNELNIPYEIEFQPNHVFLIAYPSTSKIMVQTTNPLKGVFVYDNTFKNNYINYLRENKLISKDEFDNKSLDDLFTEYYLKTKVGDLKQLAGSQYFNLGLDFLTQNKVKQALNNFTKAYYLDASLQNKFLMTASLGLMIDKTNATDPDYYKYLGLFTRTSSKDVKKDIFISLFYDMTQRQLNFEGNVDMYKRSYQYLMDKVKDSTLKSEFSFIYNFEMGRKMINNMHYNESLSFLENAYKIKPDNIDIQNMLVATIVSLNSKSFYDENRLNILNDTLDNFVKSHINLKDNDKIINLMYMVKLGLMSNYYYKGEIQKAEHFQNEFESLCNENSNKVVYESYSNIEKSYSAAAAYYFKKGKYGKARELLNKGLVYIPDSYQLKARLKALN